MQITCSDQYLQGMKTRKFLDLQTDNLINWNKDVELILLKLSEVCFLINSFVFFKSKELLKTLYSLYFYSVMTYDIIF
jgi:hypothetical protein